MREGAGLASALSWRERLEDKIGHVVSGRGSSYADPQAPKVLSAERLLAREDATVPASRAAELDLYLAELEVQVVMADQDARGW